MLHRRETSVSARAQSRYATARCAGCKSREVGSQLRDGEPRPEDRGVCNLTQDGPHDRHYHDRSALPAHDRGHDGAQARAGLAEEPPARLQAICGLAAALTGYGDGRRHPSVPAASCRHRCWHRHAQCHHDGFALPVPRDAPAARSRVRDLPHQGAAEGSDDPQSGRDQTPAGDGRHAQEPSAAEPWLWRRITCGRGRAAQGQAYRQRADDHPRRAVEGAQGSPGHVVTRDARPPAQVVEGASQVL